MLERGLLAIAVLVVLGVAYVVRDSVPAELRRLVGGSQDAAPARQTATPSPGIKHGARAARGGTRENHTLATLDAMSEPASTTVIAVKIPPFPERNAIRPGMSRDEIVRRFGPPNWKATWTEWDTLYEKYTYVDHQRATALLIQAGRVASSQTDPTSNRLSTSQINVEWD